jgi:hypothetical protein
LIHDVHAALLSKTRLGMKLTRFGATGSELLWQEAMTLIAKGETNGDSVSTILAELTRMRFFGSLELKLEAGRVVLIRKTETLKPPFDCRDNRGTGNERTP